MTTGHEQSSCYAAQLQIDSFLDGELSNGHEQGFLAHVGGCVECAQELRYAQQLYEAVMDLPSVDCGAAFDARVDALIAGREPRSAQGESRIAQGRQRNTSLLESFFDVLRGRGAWSATAMGLCAVVVAVVVTLLATNDGRATRQEAPQIAEAVVERATPATTFDAADVRVALEELNTAIDYLNRVSRQTEEMIGERFVVLPLQQSISGSLRRASFERDADAQGPI
jgi:hypothetical protein